MSALMTTEERLTTVCSIIDMCKAGSCLLGHADVLVSIEDHPAVRGVGGLLAGIELLAMALEAAMVEEV